MIFSNKLMIKYLAKSSYESVRNDTATAFTTGINAANYDEVLEMMMLQKHAKDFMKMFGRNSELAKSGEKMLKISEKPEIGWVRY